MKTDIPTPKPEPHDKYREGNCEICENFSQLHERDGQFICSECMEEKGEEPHEDEE